MSPQELRNDILRSYKLGKSGGRHILSMTHMMQYTMPAANIQAILDTVAEIQSEHPEPQQGSLDEEGRFRIQSKHLIMSSRRRGIQRKTGHKIGLVGNCKIT